MRILIIIVFSLVATWPFFKSGYFSSHDGEWMVIRFSAFHQTLASGQFPVRFVDRLNNNFGYPVMNFLYPLPFYLAEIPKTIGLGFVDSIKVVFVFSTLISAIAMYWALSEVFTRNASLVGAITYLFVPYRFVDLYVRGSLGEIVAFAFLPLILGCIFKVSKDKNLFTPLLAVFTGALIISHNVIAAIFIPFFLIASFYIAKKQWKRILGAFILGFCLSAFFWIPALHDLKFVQLSRIEISNIADHLINIKELFDSSWDYGPTPANGLPVQLGIFPIITAVSVLFLRFNRKISGPLVDLMLISFTLVPILMLKQAGIFWQYAPFGQLIQFPWRLLALVLFISAYLAAYLINQLKPKLLPLTLFVLAIIVSGILYTKPQNFVNRPDEFYSTNEDSTTVLDEYLPIWVQEKPTGRANTKLELESGNAQINLEKIEPINYEAKIAVYEESTIRVNTIYFPGLNLKVNDKKANFNYENKYGLLNFRLPQGDHKVIIKYGKTPVHLISEVISIFSLVTIGVLIFKLWPRKNS